MNHACTKHQPGTRTCYIAHACRCRPCTDAATAWQRRFNHAKATTGRGLAVPVAPIRAHLEYLRAQGMTLREIATAAGVSPGTLDNIATGKIGRTSRRTAERIAAVRGRTHGGHGTVDATGAARRLQALAALGWDGETLAPHLDYSPNQVRHLRAPVTPTIHAATHDRVAAVYNRLQATPGTKARARALAARNGWAPPAAWDDGMGPHGIDNPAATPTGIPTGRRTTARSADVIELAEFGTARHEIARRLGLAPGSVERALLRAGRHDLATRTRPREGVAA